MCFPQQYDRKCGADKIDENRDYYRYRLFDLTKKGNRSVIPPCVMIIFLTDSLEKHVPAIAWFQYLLTGLHCRRDTKSRGTWVITMKNMTPHKTFRIFLNWDSRKRNKQMDILPSARVMRNFVINQHTLSSHREEKVPEPSQSSRISDIWYSLQGLWCPGVGQGHEQFVGRSRLSRQYWRPGNHQWSFVDRPAVYGAVYLSDGNDSIIPSWIASDPYPCSQAQKNNGGSNGPKNPIENEYHRT